MLLYTLTQLFPAVALGAVLNISILQMRKLKAL